MSGAKPWQIALIVIGLLAGAAGVVYAMTSGKSVDLVDSMTLVDVNTGELFRVNTNNRSIIIPMKRKDNDQRTLMVAVFDDGEKKWIVPERYRGPLGGFTDQKLIDPATGVIGIDATAKPIFVDW